MQPIITSTSYFNPEGCNIFNEQMFLEQSSIPETNTGFIDFNRSKYKWAKSIYDMSINRFWTPQQVNTSSEDKNFRLLSDNEKEIYKRVFSQLSFDDSIQSNFIVNLLPKTNNQIVRATLLKQAEVEVLHSNSYAFLLNVVGNSNEVFDLYKTDYEIKNKNHRIAQMYARHINGNTQEDFLMSAMASVCLEGVFFLTGFSYIFAMGNKIQGSADMVAEIAVDEVSLHLPLFANITNTLLRENNFGANIKDKMRELLYEAYEIEYDYAKSLSKYSILGVTLPLVDLTIRNFINDRCKILNLEPIFPVEKDTPLQKLITDRINERNGTKTNFFEGNVRNYSVGSIDMDDF